MAFNYFTNVLLILGSIQISLGQSDFEYCGLVYDVADKQSTRSIPLQESNVHMEIRGLSVGIKAELKYQNPTAETLEVVFVFPLSNEAAIYSLEAVVGGRHLKARIEELEEARKTYQEAVDSGKTAILLENENPGVGDIYRLSLGNLPAYAIASIVIGYVQPMDEIMSDGVLSITLPMVMNPRYTPLRLLEDEMGRKKLNLRRENGNYVAVSTNTYKFSFTANIRLGGNQSMSSVETRFKNDTIDVLFDEAKTIAMVKLLSEFDRRHDFAILIKSRERFQPITFIEPKTAGKSNFWLNKDVVAAWLVPMPEKQISITDFELWIVIDRSGSMMDKIENSKSALKEMMKELPDGCRFNLIGFGSEYLPHFPEIQIMTNQTRKFALQYVESIEADMGGTEILEPLEFVFKQQSHGKSPKNVLLLTDGQVTNTYEVIRLCRNYASTVRVFSIGIGEGASTALVNDVAKVTGGMSAFVRSSSDRLVEKLRDMLVAITMKPTETSFLWEISPSATLKSKIPEQLPKYVVKGKPIRQFALLDRLAGQKVSGSVSLSSDLVPKCSSQSCKLLFNADFYSDELDLLPLHRLAAKLSIMELTNQYYSLEVSERSDEMKMQIIQLSKASGVLSDFTALLAVDTSTNEAVNQTMKSQRNEEITYQSVIGSSATTSSIDNFFKFVTIFAVLFNFSI